MNVLLFMFPFNKRFFNNVVPIQVKFFHIHQPFNLLARKRNTIDNQGFKSDTSSSREEREQIDQKENLDKKQKFKFEFEKNGEDEKNSFEKINQEKIQQESKINLKVDRIQKTKKETTPKTEPKIDKKPGWAKRKESLKEFDGWKPKKKLSRPDINKIRFLNKELPDEYPLRKLSEMFKISYESARRIVKSRFDPEKEMTMKEKIAKSIQEIKERKKEAVEEKV